MSGIFTSHIFVVSFHQGMPQTEMGRPPTYIQTDANTTTLVKVLLQEIADLKVLVGRLDPAATGVL